MTEPGNRPDEGTLRLINRLQTIFRNPDLYNVILECQGAVAQSLLDGFQWLLDRPECESNSDFRNHLVVVTQRLAKRSKLYPICYELKNVTLENQLPVGAGGFADIYKGRFEGRLVCLKAVRTYQSSQNEQLLKAITHESILWGQLDHENVLSFYGLYTFNNRVCFVSPWMEAGDVRAYLENHPKANRGQLVVDVAKGLQYLHENKIVHGDLKGPNILINEAAQACLTDFGISAMSVSEFTGWVSTSSVASKGGSVRWQAPELFDVITDTIVKNTKESDVYAWSCVCYEIFTSTLPFADLQRDSTIGFHIMNGVRPARPSDNSSPWCEWGLTTHIWTLMEECWDKNPSNRPTLPQIIDRLWTILTPEDLRPRILRLSPNRFRQRLKDAMNLMGPFVELDHILSHIEKSHQPPTQIDTMSPSQQVTNVRRSEHILDTRKSERPSKRPRRENRERPSMLNVETVNQASPQSHRPVPSGPNTAFANYFDSDSIAPELIKTGEDWFVIFNPHLRQSLDISLVHTFEHYSVVCCVRFSPDGRYLAAGSNRRAEVYDVMTCVKMCTLSVDGVGDNYIRSVCFSPDGKFLAAGAEDKQLRIWNLATKRIHTILKGHTRDVYSIDFSRDGRFIVSGSADQTVRIWDRHDGSSKVYTTNDEFSHNHSDNGVASVAISPNGQLVASGSVDTIIRIWDIMTGTLLESLRGHVDSVYDIAFTPDGKGLISGSLDKTLKYWDISALAMRKDELALQKFGSPCLHDFIGHKDYVLSVSHNGRWVVSGSKDRGVGFWDIHNGTLQFMLQGHKNSVISVDMNSAENMLATGSGDWSIRIWRYETVP